MHQNNNMGVSVEMTELPRPTAGINAHNNADIRPILDAVGESSCNLYAHLHKISDIRNCITGANIQRHTRHGPMARCYRQ